MHFETDDLVSYFRTREHSNSLPSLGELRSLAKKLYRQYCTTKAYQQALESPDLVHQRTASVTVPRGTKSLPQNRPVAPKQAPHATTESRNSQEVIRDEDAEGSDGEEEEEIVTDEISNGGDWGLANSIIMMRDGLLFTEVSHAISHGDIGRVWEVLKVFCF